MADQARKQTDKILSDMEKEVRSIYDRASADISAKWYKYMESHEKSLKSAYNALQEAIKSGDNDAISKARSNYERMVKNVTLNNDKYKAMLNETTAKLSHTNEVALDYVNGNMAKIYTLNYNEFANQDITGYTFTLVNEQAVKNLATEDKSLLPKKKVDIPKDKLWNQKNINSEVLQGILQGENITKIADRLQHVTDMNEKSAIRNARTMVTGAENKGRQDSFKKAESDGVVMVRRWVATHDERTRAWHTDLDGVEVGLDEPWSNEYGEIMYPGDPSADPANVYNCRCSIRSIVQGFKRNEEEVPDITEEDRYVDVNAKSDDIEYAGHKNDDIKYVKVNSEEMTPRGINAMSKELGISKEEAKEYGEAIKTFSGKDTYSDIRAASRGEITSPDIARKASKIEEYIDIAPKWEGGRLYRGLYVDDDIAKAFVEDANNGINLNMMGLSSWSSSDYQARKFANVLEGDYRKKTSVVLIHDEEYTNFGTSISHLSKFKDEKEVLMSSKVEFVPERVKVWSDGKTVEIYGKLRKEGT